MSWKYVEIYRQLYNHINNNRKNNKIYIYVDDQIYCYIDTYIYNHIKIYHNIYIHNIKNIESFEFFFNNITYHHQPDTQPESVHSPSNATFTPRIYNSPNAWDCTWEDSVAKYYRCLNPQAVYIDYLITPNSSVIWCNHS